MRAPGSQLCSAEWVLRASEHCIYQRYFFLIPRCSVSNIHFAPSPMSPTQLLFERFLSWEQWRKLKIFLFSLSLPQRNYGIFLLGDVQKSSEHHPRQSALGVQMASIGSCQPQPFCDSVNYILWSQFVSKLLLIWVPKEVSLQPDQYVTHYCKTDSVALYISCCSELGKESVSHLLFYIRPQICQSWEII